MLKCVQISGCGRLVVAARDVSAGETVFAEEAYVVAPNVDHPKRRVFCVHCTAPVTVPEHSHCGQCGSIYCSHICSDRHAEHHVQRGECAALKFSRLLRSKIPEEDMDTFQTTCLVIARCVSEGKVALLALECGGGEYQSSEEYTVRTVGHGAETGTPMEFLNNTNVLFPGDTTYGHVQCLATNLAETDPEVMADFSKLFDIYIVGVNKRKIMGKLQGGQHFLPASVSRDVFLSITCALLCNGFGFWDTQDRKQATAVYPRSSYFNHSCAPNLGRRNLKHSRVMHFFAARDVAAGEQLCISYVNVKKNAAGRIAKLKATYSFVCQCPRCLPGADDLLANTTIGDAVPPMCDTCHSKIMQPLPDGKSICPCCDVIQQTTRCDEKRTYV